MTIEAVLGYGASYRSGTPESATRATKLINDFQARPLRRCTITLEHSFRNQIETSFVASSFLLL